MNSNSINLALIQSSSFETAAENIEYISQQLAIAADNKADLVLLQELHNTPYFCIEENPACFDLAEAIPGPSTDIFSKLAKEHKLVVVTSLFEKRASGLYHNTAVVFDKDGTIAGKYRKMHIPDDPGFYEKYYFTPGDLGFKPVQTSIGKLGILICWDQWFPEAARLMTLAGADILLYPTAIGWDPKDTEQEQKQQLDAWITVQRSHAIANGLPVASCNRTGTESSTQLSTKFWGNSFICGPQGELLAQASSCDNETISTSIDLEQTEQIRRTWPYLRDRRIDAYSDLTRRFLDEE
ncbi:MAG: carbon-nitrogen hydrolase [Gammaproteobacteria bacterium]|nr:carbon-nitrogen hydrolase [Gammaproteobacteria bacterium]